MPSRSQDPDRLCGWDVSDYVYSAKEMGRWESIRVDTGRANKDTPPFAEGLNGSIVGLNRFAVDRRAGVLPLAIFLLLISQLSFL
jgi:hypothetical protein